VAAEINCEIAAAVFCAELPAGVEVAWETATTWSATASGVVVFGGAVNRVNSEALADDPA
jgi:hypothetical protein